MFKEFLKNNEENVISFVTIAVSILAIIIVVIIWATTSIRSNTSNVSAALNAYESVDYVETMKSNYETILVNLLKTNNTDELYQKTNLDFLSDNELTESNFKKYLLTNNLIGNSISIISSTYYVSDSTYIFRFYYKNSGEYKYVNVIEYRPNDYEISFEQEDIDGSMFDLSYTGKSNDIVAKLTISEIGEEYVRCNIMITNNNVLDAKIDFNSINTFYLIGDDINVPLAGVVAENVTILTSGSTINRELYFSISSEDFQKCDGLKIKNVQLDNEFFDIIIEF